MANGGAMRNPGALINERMAWVDDELRAVLPTAAGEPAVYGMLRYHLGWTDAAGQAVEAAAQRRFGGKRLRGVLTSLACEACGGDGRRAVPAAAAVELIHNFSLIHDDIEDGDEERRHRATLWRLWGVPQAINAGSNMQSLVTRAALRLTDRGVGAAAVLGIVRLLTDAVVLMTEGQCLDISFQDAAGIDVAGYFAMTERKTAALLAVALECGARLAGDAGAESARLMYHFGRAFGLAFQARDDHLGVWGDPAVTGKPVGSDIERGKRSLPIVLAISRSADQDLLLRQLEARDTVSVMAALEALDVRAEVEAIVAGLTAEALCSLEELGDGGDAGYALASIARTALGRVQ
jgi:geranylgeranyl diphosphate synthase, type I